MNQCEPYEILLSTWIDGQLDRRGQTECLDHVVRCAACRGFYVDARALEGLVAAVRNPVEAEAPSPEVWRRIESSVVRGSDRPRRVPVWALQAAAVLVVVLGATLAVWNGSFAPQPRQDEILLGQSDSMTESRFLELTREVLSADPRYRSAMYRIMEQVVRDTTASSEGSAEGPVQRFEERGIAEPAEAAVRRIPA